MAKANNRTKKAISQAHENTAVQYAKDAGKSTVLDKVKSFMETGRQQRVQALEDTAAHYANNAGKSAVLDKVKDFVETGRQQRVQALEDTATYYANWIKENDRALWNRFITKEEDVTQPTTLGRISSTGDDELDAYLRDINARANRAADNSRTAVNFRMMMADGLKQAHSVTVGSVVTCPKLRQPLMWMLTKICLPEHWVWEKRLRTACLCLVRGISEA